MRSGLIAYAPDRIRHLQRCARRVAEHLSRLPGADDLLAAEALGEARIVRSHIEADWLPLLARIASSTAMMAPTASYGFAPLGWQRGDHEDDDVGWWDDLFDVGPEPWEFGPTNAEALATAETAAAAGEPGRFVGTTKTYDVVETPPTTTVPTTSHRRPS